MIGRLAASLKLTITKISTARIIESVRNTDEGFVCFISLAVLIVKLPQFYSATVWPKTKKYAATKELLVY